MVLIFFLFVPPPINTVRESNLGGKGNLRTEKFIQTCLKMLCYNRVMASKKFHPDFSSPGEIQVMHDQCKTETFCDEK